MKVFTGNGYHVASLPLPVKCVYTLFLICIALGIWSSVEIHRVRVGDADGVAARYVGESAASNGVAASGPSIELPFGDDSATPEIDLEWTWILDLFHQHIFSIAVVYLILAHLFVLTGLPPAFSGGIVFIAGAAALAHTAAPLLIHWSGGLLWLMPVSGAAMAISWSVIVLWTLWAMWLALGSGQE
ncbi:MAG: hypothetical protein CME06_06475 [Gemmatimonadetes bacterium]|nr:hypothetical protein [Gemmatimonadota bacterium]